jgi:hypothetical protein
VGLLVQAAQDATGRRCRFGAFIDDKLDDDDLEALDRTNPDGTWTLTNVFVHEFTKEQGQPVSADVIGRHRTGRCMCP